MNLGNQICILLEKKVYMLSFECVHDLEKIQGNNKGMKIIVSYLWKVIFQNFIINVWCINCIDYDNFFYIETDPCPAYLTLANSHE